MLAVITDYAVVDRIINDLNLTFAADRPLPPSVLEQVALIAAATRA